MSGVDLGRRRHPLHVALFLSQARPKLDRVAPRRAAEIRNFTWCLHSRTHRRSCSPLRRKGASAAEADCAVAAYLSVLTAKHPQAFSASTQTAPAPTQPRTYDIAILLQAVDGAGTAGDGRGTAERDRKSAAASGGSPEAPAGTLHTKIRARPTQPRAFRSRAAGLAHLRPTGTQSDARGRARGR